MHSTELRFKKKLPAPGVMRGTLGHRQILAREQGLC